MPPEPVLYIRERPLLLSTAVTVLRPNESYAIRGIRAAKRGKEEDCNDVRVRPKSNHAE